MLPRLPALILATGLTPVLLSTSLPALRAHVVATDATLVLPAIELRVEVTDTGIETVAHLPVPLFLKAVLEVESFEAFEALDAAEVTRRITAKFGERHPVKIDRLAVTPSVGPVEIQLPELAPGTKPGEKTLRFGAVQFPLEYSSKTAPRQVAITWQLYPEPSRDASPLERVRPAAENFIVAEFEAEGKASLVVLSREEPEYIWHSEARGGPPPDWKAPVEAAPAPLRVHVLATVLGILAFGLLLRPRSLRASRRMMMSLVLLIAAVASASLGVGSVDLPGLGAARIERPDRERALEIFRSLHANIYRAFDYTHESDIYDTLARSVDGPRLREIYADIYNSLILEEEGGAVCRIQRVEILEADLVDPPGEAPGDEQRLGVRCRWRVHGLVKHWGHTHARTQEFHADYALAPRGATWKITDTSLLEHRPVSEAARGAAPSSPERD